MPSLSAISRQLSKTPCSPLLRADSYFLFVFRAGLALRAGFGRAGGVRLPAAATGRRCPGRLPSADFATVDLPAVALATPGFSAVAFAKAGRRACGVRTAGGASRLRW